MSDLSTGKARKRIPVILPVCVLILAAGIAAVLFFPKLKKPPQKKEVAEREIAVEAIEVTAGDYPVWITGFGEVKALNTVTIAPEVSGRVTRVHPDLEMGEVIPADALLFAIDPTRYVATREEARAQVAARESAIARLQTQQKLDSARLATLDRNEQLMKKQYERVLDLYTNDNVGTKSAVETSERSYNNSVDQAAILRRSVELYHVQIREAESSLQSAKAMLNRAEYDVERCQVSVPFEARVTAVNLEPGQVVPMGNPVLTLADDTILEVQVPLDSRDAREWLMFEERESARSAWFSNLFPVECVIRWTESSETHVWNGDLHRVVRFEPETRTLTVAIRVTAEQALAGCPQTLPLTEGMFCHVEIPGRPLDNVFRVPRAAVSFENTVYAEVNGRLRTVPVFVTRVAGDYAYIASGLTDGDRIITTRLAAPLENSLLSVKLHDEGM